MSLGAIHFEASKPLTSPEIRVGNAEASKWVIGPMPERPAVMPSQLEARSLPSGERMPIPVMTTRRLDMECSFNQWDAGTPACRPRNERGRMRGPVSIGVPPMDQPGVARGRGLRRPAADAPRATALRLDVRLDVVDGLLDRGDLLGFLVRDLALELFLEGHRQLDGVQRIGAQVVDEGRARADLLFLDAQLLHHNLLDAFFDAAHGFFAPWGRN